jgi:hypothetical protein
MTRVKQNDTLYNFDQDARFRYTSRYRRKLAQNLEQLQALLVRHDLQIRCATKGREHRYIVYSQTRHRDGQAKVVGYGFAHVFIKKDGTYDIDDYFSFLDSDPNLLQLLERNPLHLELFELVPKRRYKITQADLLKVANALSGRSFEHLALHGDWSVEITASDEACGDLLRFLRDRLSNEYAVSLEEGGSIAVRRPYID